MRGGLLRGKPPLLFCGPASLQGKATSCMLKVETNKTGGMPNTGVRAMRCASCCSTSRTWTGCWARMSAARKRSRSMIASNGHAPKRFGETRSHTFMCVQRVSGALPLTSRGQFFAAAETARKAKWVPLCPACHVFSRPSQRCFLCFPA